MKTITIEECIKKEMVNCPMSTEQEGCLLTGIENYLNELQESPYKRISMKIKEYVRSLDTPDNTIYKEHSLLIKSCFSKALEIIEEESK